MSCPFERVRYEGYSFGRPVSPRGFEVSDQVIGQVEVNPRVQEVRDLHFGPRIVICDQENDVC
jgi:hypothetical protein